MSDEAFSEEELARARRYSLVIRWSDDDQVYVVSAPELPGVMTHGRTLAEAVDMGVEAIATLLSALPEIGKTPPPPPLTARRVVIDKPPRYDAVAIRAIRQRLNVSQAVFADALNVSRGAVRAWEQGQRSPDGAAQRLLELADRQPAALFQAIGESSQAMRWRPRQ
jgi:DNA-binding transcriptional regulator YiaG